MKPAPLRVPDGHEEMRQRVLESFAGLFESQTRTRRFASSITELTRDTHDELLSGLRDSIQRIASLDIAPDTRKPHRLRPRSGGCPAANASTRPSTCWWMNVAGNGARTPPTSST